MSSPRSSPRLLFDDIYKTSLEPMDRNIIDGYNVCEPYFMDPMTDWQANSFKAVAPDYHYDCLLPPSSNDLLLSDILLESQTRIDNGKPSLHLEEPNISVSTEGIHGNWKGLGSSFIKKRTSAFMEWKAINPDPSRSCKRKKYSSLQKRCIRFLNDINNHKIPRELGYNNNSSNASKAVSNNYDKLAIHHVVAERKRREQMSDIFSALRSLVPVKPKNAGRATVLLQTKDYVIDLKKNIEQLEQRNRELEALVRQKS